MYTEVSEQNKSEFFRKFRARGTYWLRAQNENNYSWPLSFEVLLKNTADNGRNNNFNVKDFCKFINIHQ